VKLYRALLDNGADHTYRTKRAAIKRIAAYTSSPYGWVRDVFAQSPDTAIQGYDGQSASLEVVYSMGPDQDMYATTLEAEGR
jgi:hypothetical protein